MTEAKPNWQLTIQVSGTDALAMILKEPNQFRVVGDIVNLGSADTVQETSSPPPVQAAPPVNGSGREGEIEKFSDHVDGGHGRRVLGVLPNGAVRAMRSAVRSSRRLPGEAG